MQINVIFTSSFTLSSKDIRFAKFTSADVEGVDFEGALYNEDTSFHGSNITQHQLATMEWVPLDYEPER